MKHFFLSIIIVSVFCCKGIAAQDETAAIIASGNAKLNSQDYTGAIKDFNKAIRITPRSHEAYRGRASAKFNLQQLDEAQKDIARAMGIDENTAENYMVRGEIFAALKDNASAMNDYNKAIELNPKLFRVISLKALLLFQTEKEKEAFDLINESIKQNSSAAELYYGRGLLHNSKLRYESAIEDFEKCQSLDPSYSLFNVLMAKGTAYLAMQDVIKAEQSFTKAIELVPQNPVGYSSRGRIAYEKGQFQEAIEDYTKAFELSPENNALCFNLGMAYHKIDNIQGACEHFHKACRLGNNNACKMVMMHCVKK